MRRPILVVVSVLMLGASTARADGIPSPVNDSAPSHIDLVGHVGGVPDAVGRFVVVRRDLAGNPVTNSLVEIDLSDCPDLAICADQTDPAMIVTCAGGVKKVGKLTDSDGVVAFTIMGWCTAAAAAPGAASGCARILGMDPVYGPYVINRPTVTAYDRLQGNGVEVTDASAWLADLGTGVYFGRSDYNHDGSIGIADLARWLGVHGTGASSESCRSLPGAHGVCP